MLRRLAFIVALLLGGAATAFAPPAGRQRPRPPRKPPEQTKREIKGVIGISPAEALRQLREDDESEADTKLELTREAVEAVAVRAETNASAVAGLAEVRAARTEARQVPDDVRRALLRIDRAAERRVLAEALNAPRGRAGEWADVTKAARASLATLADARLEKTRALESVEFRVGLAEARQALTQTRDHAERAAATSGFAAALLAASDAAALRRVERDRLTETLARQLDGLLGAAELREMMAGKWDKAPDVAAVRAAVERFSRGTEDADGLGKQLLLDVAAKAMLDGHPDAALKLLPDDAPAANAKKLLADLKALTLGEGEVSTWPATTALSQSPGDVPRGLAALVPAAERKGWRAPATKKSADEPAIERARKAGEALRLRAARAAATEKTSAETKAGQSAKRLTTLHERIMAPEVAERKKLVAVEAELDRRLLPAERVRARASIAENKPAREIAAALKAAPASDADEEKAFLAEVERRLGRTMNNDERFDARRMRKQGRTSAEVADVVRK